MALQKKPTTYQSHTQFIVGLQMIDLDNRSSFLFSCSKDSRVFSLSTDVRRNRKEKRRRDAILDSYFCFKSVVY
jgi:hypothetical protein